jgi:hypothetical protein
MNRIDIRRKWWWLLITAGLVGAAYITGMFLREPTRLTGLFQGELDANQVVRQTSPDLPATVPQLFGIVIKRSDQRLTIRDSPVINGNVSGNPPANQETRLVDVVVSRKTRIMKDVSDSVAPQFKDGIQMQAVTVSEMDEISQNAFVMIWGDWQGDRINADVICFQNR